MLIYVIQIHKNSNSLRISGDNGKFVKRYTNTGI